MRLSFVVILVAAAFFIGISVGTYFRSPAIERAAGEVGVASFVPVLGFTAVNATIRDTTVSLLGGCRAVQFDVTPDQAYSIAVATNNVSSERPLGHDVFREVMDNFGVKLLQANIDRHEAGVYKATMYMRRDNDVLAIDSRPSDAIAMAARYKAPVLMKNEILDQQGKNVC
ncbi:MAG: bifunctional nuclease family protein [Candidatus Aenigmarchaeota archaeon]|nr:bifunctional nuclease family protein [Candidatus Aenigmarchaeota archaeon]